MKLAPVAQNSLEWIALKTGLVPSPLAYSHFGFMMSKALLEAVDKGVFEAIGHKKVSLQHIAQTCRLNEKALKSVLGVLATMNVIHYKNNLFYLAGKAKKWILRDSPDSLYWLMMFDNRVCFKWMDYAATFLETGQGLQYHDTFTDEEWFYYQKAMAATAAAASKEVAKKITIAANAAQMLDIGGAHGLYSVALCKKNAGLTSVVLDLPAAVAEAKPILEKYKMEDRVRHQAGNVLTDDLGEQKYDVIIMANVAHHFTNEENIMVTKKAFRALKPGGTFTILEVLRSDIIKYNGDMLSALGNFFFALSSTSGIWSHNEIKHWQKEAGFTAFKKNTFLTIPGYAAVSAKKV